MTPYLLSTTAPDLLRRLHAIGDRIRVLDREIDRLQSPAAYVPGDRLIVAQDGGR